MSDSKQEFIGRLINMLSQDEVRLFLDKPDESKGWLTEKVLKSDSMSMIYEFALYFDDVKIDKLVDTFCKLSEKAFSSELYVYYFATRIKNIKTEDICKLAKAMYNVGNNIYIDKFKRDVPNCEIAFMCLEEDITELFSIIYSDDIDAKKQNEILSTLELLDKDKFERIMAYKKFMSSL